jgi:hypothetical protein
MNQLKAPPDPASDAYPVFTSGLSAGYLTAPDPAAATLPASGTNGATNAVYEETVPRPGSGDDSEGLFCGKEHESAVQQAVDGA